MEFDPSWGEWLPGGIDMYELAEATSERLLRPLQINFTSTTGNIASITFVPFRAFPDEGVLIIDFHNGRYRYFDVPMEVASGFEGAPSATAYFNGAIRDQYEYEGM